MEGYLSLFISSGRLDRMYTMRVVVERRTSNGVVYKADEYWCNLSTDWEKAVSKASSISKEFNLPLHASEFSLEEIRRSKEKINKEQREQIEAEERRRVEIEVTEYNEVLDSGVFPMGKYAGELIKDVAERDMGYIRYMASNAIENSIGRYNAMCMMCKEFMDNVVVEELPEFEEGEIIERELKIEKMVVVSGIYGNQMLISFIDKGNNFFKCYTTSKKIISQEGNGFVKYSMMFSKVDSNGTVCVKRIKVAK